MTAQRKWLVVAVILVSTIAVVAVGYRVCWVAHIDNDTEILSNDSEAYLFIKSSRLGYRRNLLQFAFEFVGARFGISPTETKRDLLIVRVTSTGFERSDLTDTAISSVGALGNHLYTYANGELMRVTGTHFEPASADVQALFKATDALLKRDGWSWRSNVLSGPPGASKFSLDIGGQQWTIVAHNNRSSQGSTAIDLQKGDEPSQRVWYLDTRPRYTNKNEYEAFLSQGAEG